jgi:hypothetical protein
MSHPAQNSPSARSGNAKWIAAILVTAAAGLATISFIRRPNPANPAPDPAAARLEVHSALSNYSAAIQSDTESNAVTQTRSAVAEIKEAGSRLEGQEAAITTAIGNTFSRISKDTLRYRQMVGRLTRNETFNVARIRDTEGIHSRRKELETMLTENRKQISLVDRTPEIYRSELLKAGVATNLVASASQDFNRGFGRTRELMLEIRHCDTAIATNTLAILGLLEARTNDWKFDITRGRIEIAQADLRNRVNQSLTAIQQISQHQAELQRKLQ